MDGLACCCTTIPVKIGRTRANDLPLTLDKHVSSAHALVGFENGHYWIEDPKSMNGTWLDGNEIPRNTRVQISPGNIFVAASSAVELLSPTDAPRTVTPADVQARVTDLIEKVSPASRQVMDVAEEEARAGGLSRIGVCHVFFGLCRLEDRSLTRVFEGAEVERELLSNAVREFTLWAGDYEWVTARVAYFSGMGAQARQDTMRFTPRVAKVMTEARELARAQGSMIVEPLHLLYGILSEGRSIPVTVLRKAGKDTTAMAEKVRAALLDKTEPLLTRIGRNLTDFARQGRFSPVICREEDIKKVMDILSRPSKNNAVIVGKAGIGKTALVHGVAQETARPNCPRELRGKNVIEIPVDGLTDRVRSAKELEKRFLELAKSAQRSENTILFLDDIHMVLAAGRGGHRTTVAPAVLDAAFGDDDVLCIATTTNEGYETYFKNDPALDRCFEVLPLSELSEETTASILQYLKGVFEDRYNVTISDEAVSLAVTLPARHAANVQFPSKAVQALDQACASVGSQDPATSTRRVDVGAEEVTRVLTEWTGLTTSELLAGDEESVPGGEDDETTIEGDIEEVLSRHGAWLMAREISDRIDSLQSQYHLADAWDRRAALKDLLRRELSRMPPERRQLVATHLRDMFPLAEGDPQLTGEMERLRAQMVELKEQMGSRPASGQFIRAVEGALLGREMGEEQDAESGTTVVRAVQDLLQFVMDLENVIKAFLETLLAQGESKTRFDLPFWAKDIERLMTEIVADGAEESRVELARYLSDLSCWLMACVTGYQQGALEWSVGFRDKMSPKSIEQRVNLPAWKRVAGLASNELWDVYTEMVRDMHADLVEDEVRDMAARIAKEQYSVLKRRSK